MTRSAARAPRGTIRELRTDADLRAAFPLMSQLRSRITRETFASEVRRQQIEGYRLYGSYHQGRLVALAGVRRSHTLARGEHLFIDDLVTSLKKQRRGFGRELVAFLAAEALEEGLTLICLDSRDSAVGFYLAVGFAAQTSVPMRIQASDALRASRR